MKDIETAKQEAKEKLLKMVDEYFMNNTEAIASKKYTIDTVEDFLMRAKADTDKILKETAEEVLKASESELVKKKRYAQYADKS
jgi:hypothetical protein